jgi:hypothetical protein
LLSFLLIPILPGSPAVRICPRLPHRESPHHLCAWTEPGATRASARASDKERLGLHRRHRSAGRRSPRPPASTPPRIPPMAHLPHRR